MLYITYYMLHITYYVLHIAHHTLYIIHYTLYLIPYTLYIIHDILSKGYARCRRPLVDRWLQNWQVVNCWLAGLVRLAGLVGLAGLAIWACSMLSERERDRVGESWGSDVFHTTKTPFSVGGTIGIFFFAFLEGFCNLLWGRKLSKVI